MPRSLKPYGQGGATVDIPVDAIMNEVAAYADEITEATAKEVLKRARRTTQFDDDTGYLRRSGKGRASRFNKGERIVGFSAPHAHLVEHGHLITAKDGTVTGHVPGYPFLGPARDSVVADLPAIIRSVVPPTIKVGGK